MEAIDWQLVIPGTLAIAIFVGGMFMMFSNLWTDAIRSPNKPKKQLSQKLNQITNKIYLFV